MPRLRALLLVAPLQCPAGSRVVAVWVALPEEFAPAVSVGCAAPRWVRLEARCYCPLDALLAPERVGPGTDRDAWTAIACLRRRSDWLRLAIACLVHSGSRHSALPRTGVRCRAGPIVLRPDNSSRFASGS